jgi:peptidoglycan/LPS O-acetylase OafA/YrhL
VANTELFSINAKRLAFENLIMNSCHNLSINIIGMSREPTQPIAKGKYRPEIDGIRAFAVGAVIINHFNKDLLPGGYLGVDIFFVISGYVVTSSLFGRSSAHFTDFIGRFYERRIKRLFPALLVYVFIMSILTCLFTPNPTVYLRTGFTSLLGLSNLYLIKQSTDYFSISTKFNVFSHTWSLGVEEQFYLLFPLLIWFSVVRRQTKHGVRNLFLMVAVLSLVSLFGFLHFYYTNQSVAYFLMPSRFWEMASGCLIFIGFYKSASLLSMLENMPPFLVFGSIIGIMFFPTSMPIPSNVIVVGLLTILLASFRKQSVAFNILTNPKVVYIGLISYSLYLWHWGILSISLWTIGVHWWSIPFQIATIVGLAITSYECIEKPLRAKKYLFGKRLTDKSISCILILLSFGPLMLLERYGNAIYLGEESYLLKRNNFRGGGTNIQCDLRYDKLLRGSANIESCNFGSRNAAQSFFFVGSSHSGNLTGMIDNLGLHSSVKLYSLYVGGTFFPPLELDHLPLNDAYRLAAQPFNEKQELLLHLIKRQARNGDLVVISNHLELYTGLTSPIEADQRKIVDLYFAALNRFSYLMKSRGVRVVLFGPSPYFVNFPTDFADTQVCQRQWFRAKSHYSCQQSVYRDQLVQSNSLLADYSRRWMRSHSNAFVFNKFDYLCPTNTKYCKNSIGGIPYMYDRDHLNYYGGQVLSRPFLAYLHSNQMVPR